MLNDDAKLRRLLAPHLERVLVAEPAAAAARMLVDLLQNIRQGEIYTAGSTAMALSIAETADPQIIFCEYAGADLDGLAFTRALRRSNFACRKVPVVMVTSQATPAVIIGARDVGVHEFLRKPYTIGDLLKRLEAALLRPRGWVEGVGYIGPDRRRFNSAEFRGARKRRADAARSSDEAAALQALRIVAAAIGAIETDPQQAFRSLCAQANDLQRAAEGIHNMPLREAALELQRQLVAIGSAERLKRPELDPFIRKLLAFLPKDEARAARPAA